jgi:hypothetical protein
MERGFQQLVVWPDILESHMGRPSPDWPISAPDAAPTRIHEVDPSEDPRWEGFIDFHPRASVFHRKEWLRALKWSYEYEPAAISTCPPGTPLTNALVFCRVRSRWTGNRLVSLPFSDHCEPLTSSLDETESLIDDLRRRVDGKIWNYVEVRFSSSCPPAERLLSESARYVFHKLDLRPSENELFRKLHKDCVQRKIRRAERESLLYEQGSSERLLDLFYGLVQITRRRHGLPPAPLAWFRALVASFGDRIKIRVASKNGIPVAGLLTLCHRKTMTYKYACSDARYYHAGGNALLLWKAICEAKSEGFEELDLGRSDADAAGLIAFKEHWGATRLKLTYFRYPAVASRHMPDTARVAIKRLASIAPNRVLRIAGNLLYRHMG